MASSSSPFPDIFTWLCNLPPFPQLSTTSINLSPPSSASSSSQPSLNLCIKNLNNSYFSLSIFADYILPVILWTSKKVIPKPTSRKLLDDDNIVLTLLSYFIEDVLKYTPNKCPHSFKLIPPTNPQQDTLRDIFNFSFLSLTLVVCVYEAPDDLRCPCLSALIDQYACPESRQVSKTLMRLVGSNVEEQWMRSMNLAITNWISELQATDITHKMPSPMFSYSFSTAGLWKVQLYCPVIAMDVEKVSSPSPDDRLLFSLNYHQLEGVIQLNYTVDVQEEWIEVMVYTDNIRCDIIKLLTDSQLRDRGAGPSEKHFPSRISLHIAPTIQNNVISVSANKSTQNPPREFGVEKGIEASFDPPAAIGLHISAGESITTSMKPWKFEQSVRGNTAYLHWFLHDSGNGREVFSSKPSKVALLHPKSWFKNRYSSAARPFTRQGGVIFAGDEYGERVRWRVDRRSVGGSMEWEIKGQIWLTYWPNKHRTFYTETRRLDFREVFLLNLV